MKFKFGYEKLLGHYKIQEEIARRDYNDSLSQLENEKTRQTKMQKELDEALTTSFEKQTDPKGAPMALLVDIDQFVDGQKIRIARHAEIVKNFAAIVEQKLELLVAAAKERKILEKLKEKQFADYKKIQKKIDAKKTDELVVTRFRAGERR